MELIKSLRKQFYLVVILEAMRHQSVRSQQLKKNKKEDLGKKNKWRGINDATSIYLILSIVQIFIEEYMGTKNSQKINKIKKKRMIEEKLNEMQGVANIHDY